MLGADFENVGDGGVDTGSGLAERVRSADQVSAVNLVLLLRLGQVGVAARSVGQSITRLDECPLNPIGELAPGQVVREQKRQRRRRLA